MPRIYPLFSSSSGNCTYVGTSAEGVLIDCGASFTKIKKAYNKYLGGIIPLKKEVNTEKVFSEKLKYNNISIYHDGIKLEVSDNYLVPALKEGMVLFIGDKDNYGKTIIIEDLINNAAYKDRPEYSMAQIGGRAYEILEELHKVIEDNL